jgi:hypothetical protein
MRADQHVQGGPTVIQGLLGELDGADDPDGAIHL